MGFTDRTSEYKACVQFIEAISPNHKLTITSNVTDLRSPAAAEDETIESNDIFFVKTKNKEVKEKRRQTTTRRRARNNGRQHRQQYSGNKRRKVKTQDQQSHGEKKLNQ